jgi:rod shape determining protein RodA
MVGLLLLSVPAAYPFLADYQRQRIDTFLNPSLSAEAEGYNVLQATIAIGSGGLLGKGLDAGSQSQLNFLPAQHTDFIFAVTAEKLGLLGGLSIVAAFCLLIIRLVNRVMLSDNHFIHLVGFGMIAALAAPFLINVAMNLGLFPVTGVPLPFVSAGGTHMIVELTMLGLVSGLTIAPRK